jgi:hypothetical protein
MTDPDPSILSQRHGSADPDPDPHQNVMDPHSATLLGSCLFLKFPHRRFLPHTPDVFPVGDALGQPLPVGLLEVLEENVGVVHVVDPPRLVRRGRQLVEVSHPPLNLHQRKLDRELPFFMRNALSLAVLRIQLIISMRIRIQRAKPMQILIRILVRL